MKFQPVFKRRVNLPYLPMEKNTLYYVKFLGPIVQSSDHVRADAEEPATSKRKKAPPKVARVLNLETGEECQIIVPAMMNSTLVDGYPGESYVTLCFELIQHRVQGKEYNVCTVTEIDDPAVESKPVTSAKLSAAK